MTVYILLNTDKRSLMGTLRSRALPNMGSIGGPGMFLNEAKSYLANAYVLNTLKLNLRVEKAGCIIICINKLALSTKRSRRKGNREVAMSSITTERH